MDQIAHFCPEWWFKHFTAAYRGSPPPAVFQNKYQKRNMKEIQQGNLLKKAQTPKKDEIEKVRETLVP